MERATHKTKLFPANAWKRNEIIAPDKDELVVRIPEVVSVAVIGVEPTLTVVIAFDIEHVQIAVGIGFV